MVRYREMINDSNWSEDDEEEREQRVHFLNRLRDNLVYYYGKWGNDDSLHPLDFKINDDDSVEILSSCHLTSSCFSLPFANITICRGDFNMANQIVRSLKYSPKKILGDFSCGYNEFTSLLDGPISVAGSYGCQHNKHLVSLEGLPEEVGGELDFNGCRKLKVDWNSFVSCQVGGRITFPYHTNLPMLRVLGPDYTKSKIHVAYNAVEKGTEILNILRKYFNSADWKKAVVECQYELIKSGFKGNAKW